MSDPTWTVDDDGDPMWTGAPDGFGVWVTENGLYSVRGHHHAAAHAALVELVRRAEQPEPTADRET